MKTLLLISNGHGEDHIAVQLGLAARALDSTLTIQAFPLVGKGTAFTQAQIPTLTQNPVFPSGGFIRSLSILVHDLKAGLFKHLWTQKKQLNALTQKADIVICVGDIFALWMGSSGGKSKTNFLPTAKSDKFMPHSRVEKKLMKKYCTHIFTRDEITAKTLRKDNLPAQYLGNPMMDGLTPTGQPFPFQHPNPIIGILPGSRDEAKENLKLIFAALNQIHAPLNLVIAKAPTLTFNLPTSPHTVMVTEAFADVLDQSQLIIGLAGTANEQAVYWGKPVVSFPGTGPQTTVQRLTEQAKLLDHHITFINSHDPHELAQKIEHQLNQTSPIPTQRPDPAALQIIAQILHP